MQEQPPSGDAAALDAAAGHIRVQRWADAERTLSAYLLEHHTDAQALWMRGLARLGLGRLDDALADFARASKSAPQEPAPHFYSALAHYRAGRSAKAAAACRAALTVDPDYQDAHALLAGMALPGESYLRVIERIHAHLRPRTYVEIGVAEGDTLRLARPETRAIGVDPQPRIGAPLGPNVTLVAQTSDEFFAGHDVRAALGGLPVELALVDGMHHFEVALRDFLNLEALCAPDATILIHDVYPLDAATAARERATRFWTGDVWRLVLLLRAHRPDLAVSTVAAAPSGLAIVRNLDPCSTFLRDNLDRLVAEFMAVGYETLAERKAERLALVPNEWPGIRALLDAPVSS